VSAFSRGIAGGLKAIRRASAETVVYRRGSCEAQVPATFPAARAQGDDLAGTVRLWEAQDVLITAADLVLDGERILPEIGDEIDRTLEGFLLTFEVLAMDGSQNPFRYQDGGRTGLRVHAKLIRRQPV
jgi:hypothetical protein